MWFQRLSHFSTESRATWCGPSHLLAQVIHALGCDWHCQALPPLMYIIQEFEPLQRHGWPQVLRSESLWNCLKTVVFKDYIIHHRGDPEYTLSFISRWTYEAKLQVAVTCILSLTVLGDCHSDDHQSGAQRNYCSLHYVRLVTFTHLVCLLVPTAGTYVWINMGSTVS